jgi:DNA-binding FadR family transcriptional regulator
LGWIGLYCSRFRVGVQSGHGLPSSIRMTRGHSLASDIDRPAVAGHALRRYLLDLIESGALRPGERLPTERELGERFAMGRSAVRTVTAQLREQGFVTQVAGSGTYVSRPRPKDAAEELLEASPAEIMEARLLLEPQMIELLIMHATSADFAEMEHCCEQAERAPDQPGFEHWDVLLHRKIAEATRNSLVQRTYALIERARESSEWGMLKRRTFTHEIRRALEQQHRALVAALRMRDAEAAKELLREHLRQVRKNLLGS